MEKSDDNCLSISVLLCSDVLIEALRDSDQFLVALALAAPDCPIRRTVEDRINTCKDIGFVIFNLFLHEIWHLCGYNCNCSAKELVPIGDQKSRNPVNNIKKAGEILK